MGYILLGYISRMGLPKIDGIDDLLELTLTVFQMHGMHEQCSVHSAADRRMSGIYGLLRIHVEGIAFLVFSLIGN